MRTRTRRYALAMPSIENLEYVFNSILSGHLAAFNPDVLKAAPKIVKATVDLQKVRWHFVSVTHVCLHTMTRICTCVYIP